MKFDSPGLEEYQSDKDLEAHYGVWFEIEDTEMRFKCLRMGGQNVRYKKALGDFMQPSVSRRQRTGSIDFVATEEAQKKAFLKVCLVDWSGITSDGVPVTFSVEVAEEFFKEFPEILDVLLDKAQQARFYRQEMILETGERLGNS